MKLLFVVAAALSISSCIKSARVFHDQNMDFGSVATVAVMPFGNLCRETYAAERVRDVFSNMLLATGSVYVLPPGEVSRGIARAGIAAPAVPSAEEAVKLGTMLKADALITGVVREYGQVGSGTSTSNVVSLSLQMIETTTGKVIWSASSTRGGVTMTDRLLGSGGTALNHVTEEAVNDLLNKLFK